MVPTCSASITASYTCGVLRGQHESALELAHEAVDITTHSDWLNLHGATLEDHAAVEAAAGRASQARRSVADALALYEQKGECRSRKPRSRALPESRRINAQ